MQQIETSHKQSSLANRASLIKKLKNNNATKKQIKKRNSNKVIPLSFSQERLWVMSELEPDNPIYNVAGAMQFTGVLNTQALQHSLNEVVRRHEVLRSRFVADDQGVVQSVMASEQLPLFQLELPLTVDATKKKSSKVKYKEVISCFYQYANDFIYQPFDLSAQPPLRGMLAKVGEQHILLLTLHHMVSDRWSVGIIMQEVTSLYTTFCNGTVSVLPELPIQYGDFSIWQRQQNDKWEKHLSYWQQKLSGAPPLLELPTDRPRPAIQGYHGDVHEFEIPQSLTAAIKNICKQHNVTLFMLMAAALNTLLYRYTGSKDICIGYPTAGRNQSQTTKLIGFFVNTLILRCQPNDELTFTTFIQQIREQALQDQMHQELSFGQLVEELKLARNASYSPLFQVMLAVQNAPSVDFNLQGLSVQPVSIKNHIAQFDLTLFIEENEGKLSSNFEYNTDLFEAETIERIAGHLQKLLEGIVDNPDKLLKQIPLMKGGEVQQLLVDWNGNKVVYPQHLLIHQLFEAQVKTTPNKAAIVFAEQSISYAELNESANQWASYLQNKGIGSESRVGVSVKRSTELIVALLAVLKSGAAYVPLDPDYPQERLDYMVKDASIELLLTQNELIDKFQYCTCEILCLDNNNEMFEFVQSESSSSFDHIPLPPVSPDNTAYIIYTSGSTGQPKGVSISHRNLLYSTLARTNYYCDQIECFLLLSSFAFDSSVAGIFWTLSQGGCLCLPQQEKITDPLALAELVQQNKVSHLLALPSYYKAIINDSNIPLLSSLKVIIVAGEVCSDEIAEHHHHQLPGVKFYNEYGPTEGTVWSSVYQSKNLANTEITALAESSFSQKKNNYSHTGLPIGRAINNVQIFILDNQYQVVPIGISGELFIGGTGLAQGYLNQPALTAEKFIPNPFCIKGERLYKTGDLARYRSDGVIEFLGRIDSQAKIRGYRIELGEIESRLRQHSDIKEAVVLAREDIPGNKRLVAYLVSRQDTTPDSKILQTYLKQTLPDYMVPAIFISLDKLPVTANGKLDHNALITIQIKHPNSVKIPPKNIIEQVLLDIWLDLLGIENISTGDNFFELGGDSILSIQVVSRARQVGLILKPRQIFQYQTITELAVVLGNVEHIACEQGIVSGDLPLTPVQQWFFELDLENPHHWNQSVLLKSTIRIEAELLNESIKRLIQHHDALRINFIPHQNGWHQVNREEQTYSPVKCIKLDKITINQQQSYIETVCAEHQKHLNITDGPLFSIVLFESEEVVKQRLLFVMHHLIIDAVSWRILIEDLNTLYRQLSGGQPPVLPLKTSSYKQWAEKLTSHANSQSLQNELPYWLEEHKPVPMLKVDYPNAVNIEADIETVSFCLTDVETEDLLQKVPSAYQTRINDILLAALSQALCDFSGNKSVLIDVENHGREDIFDNIDISRTVGWFSSVYPMLFTSLPENNLGSFLKSIKESLRQVTNNGIAYGILRYLGNENTRASLKNQSNAQIIFNYLGQLDVTLPENSDFQLAIENSGSNTDASNLRSHEIDVIAKIHQGKLQVDCIYSHLRFNRETIEDLSLRYQTCLQNLIRHCLLPCANGYTPSDFPLAKLTQNELDQISLTNPQIEDIYPLTPLQQGLAFHSTYISDEGAYCILLGCQLNGKLNIPDFKKAWQHTVNNHSILRTHFLLKDRDIPLQIVSPNVSISIVELDWKNSTKSEQEKRWIKFQHDDWKVEFNFSQPPLMRLTLIHCSDESYYFAWSFHHIVQDGWSMSLILKDVFDGYQTLTTGSALKPHRGKPFRDYIDWIQQQDMAVAEKYWRETLAGFTAPTPLLMDKKGSFDEPALISNNIENVISEYGHSSVFFSQEETKCLQNYVKDHRLTLNTLIQGAWALLLSRYSHEDDVVFGITVSGRPSELDGIESMVGLFINTLPLRIKITKDEVIASWLQKILDQNMILRQYEYSPLVNVQVWSEVENKQSLFDSLLIFENYPADKAMHEQMGSLDITKIKINDETNYPLTITVVPGENLEISIGYELQSFTEGRASQILGHFKKTLEGFVDQSNAKISDLSLLTESEQQKILIDWNSTEIDYPRDKSIPHLFEKQVKEKPNAIAVIFEDQALTYVELNVKANQISRYLQSEGVGSEVLVGICIERSLDMVIGLLGIMKAGGTYVPLDPSYPQERLDYMLEQSKIQILLSQKKLADRFTQNLLKVICLDQQADIYNSFSTENLALSSSPDCSVYVIYTSGSTGLPKGVQISQKNLTNFIGAMQEKFNLTETDNLLALTSLSFDIAGLELYLPLICGASVVLADKESTQDVERLTSIIKNQGITFIQATPATWQLLDDIEFSAFNELTLLSGGEVLSSRLAERLLTKSKKLWNLYGPTETTVWSTIHSVTEFETNISIGRPIANTQIYLLDKSLTPVALGATGELYIGGEGLARGYLNQPELTAERFIPNPFDNTGSRLYKAGDLARYRVNGDIEYLGRIDYQVKVRGFRIELGEIESHLLEYPEIQEAVVLVTEDKVNDKYLTAYIVKQGVGDLDIASINSFLRISLPHYMLPTGFVVLERMPLTANGKVDRKSLPTTDVVGHVRRLYVEPQTTTEEIMVKIFEDVLSVEKVGVEDDFFQLGGHSLNATVLLSRIAKRFQLDVSVHTIFSTPTVSGLSIVIEDLLIEKLENLSDEEVENFLNHNNVLEHDDA